MVIIIVLLLSLKSSTNRSDHFFHHFKAYNDTYGHLQGDEALKKVARVLSRTIRRPVDKVARYGGEEFVVILPDTDMEGGWQVAEKMRQAEWFWRVKVTRIRRNVNLPKNWVSEAAVSPLGLIITTSPEITKYGAECSNLQPQWPLYPAGRGGGGRPVRRHHRYFYIEHNRTFHTGWPGNSASPERRDADIDPDGRHARPHFYAWHVLARHGIKGQYFKNHFPEFTVTNY